MKLRYQSTVLITNNVEKLKKFYSDILLQEIDMDFGACIIFKCGLSIWKLSSDHTIAMKSGRTFFAGGNKNMELCFETDEFENVYKNLIKSNLKLLHDLLVESWGQKTIRFYDPDNNLIEVGETIPCFVRRMYNEGMSVNQIVQKTSVPEKLVKQYIFDIK